MYALATYCPNPTLLCTHWQRIVQTQRCYVRIGNVLSKPNVAMYALATYCPNPTLLAMHRTNCVDGCGVPGVLTVASISPSRGRPDRGTYRKVSLTHSPFSFSGLTITRVVTVIWGLFPVDLPLFMSPGSMP